jgi:hypothetical protein
VQGEITTISRTQIHYRSMTQKTMQTLEGIGVLVTANSTRFIPATYVPCCLGASESSRFGAKLQPTGVGNQERRHEKHRDLLPNRPGRRPDGGRSSLACAAVDATELDTSMAACVPEPESSEKDGLAMI